jgi:hypothetical protein
MFALLKVFSFTIITSFIFNFHITSQPEYGLLQGTVHGEDNSSPMPCRVWIELRDTRYFRPETPSTSYKKDRSFSCSGTFSIRVPAGKATVHIERGKEFLPINDTVLIKANQTTIKEFTLKRWVAMHREGWFSSDMHVHFGSNNIK